MQCMKLEHMQIANSTRQPHMADHNCVRSDLDVYIASHTVRRKKEVVVGDNTSCSLTIIEGLSICRLLFPLL